MAETAPFHVLLAEDDEDDYALTRDALSESDVPVHLHWVRDGEELLEYLRHTGRFAADADAVRPGLILLDLNMPKKDGREALRDIKADPTLRRIPVVVLTTSNAPEDIARTYELGVNSFIQKPVRFKRFLEVVQQITDYWFRLVRLPHSP